MDLVQNEGPYKGWSRVVYDKQPVKHISGCPGSMSRHETNPVDTPRNRFIRYLTNVDLEQRCRVRVR